MDLITETSLQALIQRATDSRNKTLDNAAVEACCGIIKKMPETAYFASKLIASRLQSEDEWEAIQGLSLLDNCMRKCGPYFHSEIAKFRFLNELIKLVSPKYLGGKTSPKVRDTVLRLIHSWTVSYPQEQKIKEAYDMLKKQGVVTENMNKTFSDNQNEPCKPTAASVHKTDMVMDPEFEKKLQKLLSSKNAQDLDAANRMIKNKVVEMERKANDLERVKANVTLLAEILDNNDPSDLTQENLQLMGEIRSDCERLMPTVFHLAAEAQGSMLTDVLKVSEELKQVIDRYEALVAWTNRQRSGKKFSAEPSSSLLDLSPVDGEKLCVPDKETMKPSADFLGGSLSELDLHSHSQPIADSPSFTALTVEPEPDKKNYTDLDQLGDIFGALPSSIKSLPSVSTIVTPAKPPSMNLEKTSKQKALDELDVLGEIMLQKCKKDLEHSKASELDEPTKTDVADVAIVDLSKEQPLSEDCLALLDDAPLSFSSVTLNSDDALILDGGTGDLSNSQTPPKVVSSIPVKSLSDVSVTLESIKPSGVPPVKLLETSSGVTVVVHLAKDTPRADVSVYVVTTTSISTLPLSDYHFQVVVPKGCKFKLQCPSATSLPAHNPFLPPSAITQILLIANPNSLKVNLTCMLSYTMDDDTVTEVGETNELPSSKDIAL